jgi:UDP-N-acetylenolpyruvoylglucosamine reductase
MQKQRLPIVTLPTTQNIVVQHPSSPGLMRFIEEFKKSFEQSPTPPSVSVEASCSGGIDLAEFLKQKKLNA